MSRRRRPWIVGLTCVCLCLGALAGLSGTAGAAVAKGGQSRTQLIMMLVNPRPGLNTFVRAVTDPTSPEYRQFQPIGQPDRRFGGSAKTKHAVRAWLRARGLHGRVDPTGTFVDVSVPTTVERTDFPMLTTSGLARRSWTPPAHAQREVPAGLRGSVRAVIDGSVRLPASAVNPSGVASSALPSDALFPHPMGSSATGRTGTPAGCPAGTTAGPTSMEAAGYAGFTPNQYLNAYGFNPLLRQ